MSSSKRFREWNLDCKVYIGNLSESASKQDVEGVLTKYGPIKNLWLAKRPPGFAFVEYEDSRDADDAVRALDGTRICGSRVRVEKSHGRSKRNPPSRRGYSSRDRDNGRYYPGSGGGGGRSRRDRYSPARRGGRSRSRSRSPVKRNRYSRSRSRSHSKGRSRSRSISHTRGSLPRSPASPRSPPRSPCLEKSPRGHSPRNGHHRDSRSRSITPDDD